MNITMATQWFLLCLFVSPVLSQFMPFIDNFILQRLSNFSCGQTWQCPQNDDKFSACACDEFCEIVGDCCQGYDVQIQPVYDLIHRDLFECVSSSLVENGEEVLMVTKCPVDWTENTIRELCEINELVTADVFQTAHVSGVLSGVMFKNQYCAVCNREGFQFWQPTVGCNESFILPNQTEQTQSLPELLNSTSQCRIIALSPPAGFDVRKCGKSKSMVETCPRSWTDTRIKDLCENMKPIQPVSYIGEIMIKNIYCGYCGIPDIDQFTCPVQRTRVRLLFYSFTILFDINNLPAETSDDVVCSTNQIFDPFTKVCREALCSRNLYMRNGQCVHNITTGRMLSPECPRIRLNQDEFIISADGRLTVLNSDYVYEVGNYELTEDGNQAMICTNFTQNSTIPRLDYSIDDFQAILSIVGISLSIIGCSLTITVYFSFKSLRNIPGKIVISLCLALIVAYLTMLLGPATQESFIGCKIFAILMHFSFLFAFIWMNVMAIDVWFTFSQAYHRVGANGDETNRFTIYVIYAFVMTSVPVGIAVILNELEIGEDFSPHYGEGICWITTRNALLVFFGLPALLIITVNVILLSIAAKTIYVAQKNSARLLGKEDKGMLGIYVRLTIVMGVAYLFGVLVLLVNHAVILYLFIILNTLQGAFIFISFVCTRKVFGLVRERANSWSPSRSDNSYSGSGSRSTRKSSVLSFPTLNGKV